MAALFEKPPKPEKAKPPITRDEVMLDMQEADRLRKRRGRAANMVSQQPPRPGAKLGSNAGPATAVGAASRAFTPPSFSGYGGIRPGIA